MIQAGLLGLICVSFAVARTTLVPAPIVTTLPTTMPSGPVITSPVHTDGGCGAPSCPTVCPTPCTTTCCPAACVKPAPVCVAEVEKKTHIHTYYSIKCKTICLPYCLCGHKKSCDQPTDCGCATPCESGKNCGRPREVRRLVKRFVKEDRCEVVCKPVEPCHTTGCATGGCPTGGCAPVVMPTPMPSIGIPTALPPANLPTGPIGMPPVK